MQYNQPTSYGGSFASGIARGLDKISATMDSIEATKQNREMLRMKAQQNQQALDRGDVEIQQLKMQLSQMESKWAGEQFNKALTYQAQTGDTTLLNHTLKTNPKLQEMFGDIVSIAPTNSYSEDKLNQMGMTPDMMAKGNKYFAVVKDSKGNENLVDMLALNKMTGNITNLANFEVQQEQVAQTRLDTQAKELAVKHEQTKSNYLDYELGRIDKSLAEGSMSQEQATRMRDKAIYRDKNNSFNQARIENINSNMDAWSKDFDSYFLTNALTNSTDSDKKVVARSAALQLAQRGHNINSKDPEAVASLQVLMPLMQTNNKVVSEYIKRIPQTPIVDKASELMNTLKNNKGIDNNFLSNFISDSMSYLPESFKNFSNIKNLEALDTEQRKILASVASQIIYSKSGKAVSKQELQRIERSFTSANKNIKDILTGFMTELKSQRSELERVKSLDPLYFDLYHPEALDNVNSSLRAVDEVLNKGRSPADKTSINGASVMMFSNKGYSAEDRKAFE